MLLLSRCENDRIQFPGLGISIEVRRLTRNRVTLGIDAPKEIRVIRGEILPEPTRKFSSQTLDETIRTHLVSAIENQIDVAMEKLNVAQAELASGNAEDALFALSQALTGLHSIRVGESPSRRTPSKKESGSESTENRALTNGSATSVAEPASAYCCSNQMPTAVDDRERAPTRLLVVDPSGALINVHLSELGFAATHANGTISALYEMSRNEFPEAVIVAASQDADETESTVRVLNRCGRSRATKVIAIEPPSIEEGADLNEAEHALAHSIATRVRQELSTAGQLVEW